jgi:hypothetical protein
MFEKRKYVALTITEETQIYTWNEEELKIKSQQETARVSVARSTKQ